MSPKTLFGRIVATFTGVLAVLLLCVHLVLAERLREFHGEEVRQRLDVAAEMLAEQAERVLRRDQSGGAGGGPDAAFAAAAERLHGRDLRVTLIRADGEVVFDNEARLPVQNHTGRAELLAAAAQGVGQDRRVSATTGVATLYLARRVGEASAPAGYVRVAAELAGVEGEIATLRGLLWVSAAAALLAAALGGVIVARWLSRPLEEIEQAATALAAGDLDVRVRGGGPVEVVRLGGAIHRMSEQLRARIAGLRSARTEMEAILAAMTEGVVAVDPGERVLHMNEAAARMLGIPAPLPAGAELWRAVRFPDLEDALRAVLKGGEGRHGDAPSPRHEGRVLSLSVAPVNREIGAVAVLADVTEMRRLEQMRIDFVANVSHEIRTPLAAVMGAVETLADDPPEEQRQRFVAMAERNAQRLMAIVTDLLELSRIETEGQRMEVHPQNVGQIVRAVAGALAAAAEKKGVKLEVRSDAPGEALRILGHGSRLEQVFTNLIENAIKYTPSGGRVAVTLADQGEDVLVEVKDTGIGIPSEALPRVFERFYRVDKSRSREMGGTGLGLAIVKHAVRAHGGRVAVASEEGRGSTFTVTLPKQPPRIDHRRTVS